MVLAPALLFSLVEDVNAGAASSEPQEMVKMGNAVYFAARSQNYGTEVWDSLPEPSGLLGLVSGAALLAWLRKRRQQS